MARNHAGIRRWRDFRIQRTVLLATRTGAPACARSWQSHRAPTGFKNLPSKSVSFSRPPFPEARADQKAAAGALGNSPTICFRIDGNARPTKRTKGGEVRIVDSSTFKASTNVAMAMVTVHIRRAAGTAWAPQTTTSGVLTCGQGKNDRGCRREQGSHHVYLSGGRRRVRGKNPVALLENNGDTDLISWEDVHQEQPYQDVSRIY